MNSIACTHRGTITRIAAITLAALLSAAGGAWASYAPDGTKPAGPGVYENPGDGMCVVGILTDGTMLVDWSIKTSRDCVAWTKSADSSVNLAAMDTQAKCQTAGGAGNDGYKHGWSTNICYDVANAKGISRVDLDNTDSMCLSKGGTVVTTGKCVAYGWIYNNRKADGTLPVTGTGLSTTDGVQAADGLGFCATAMRMTSATYTSATTCPSRHNSRANADPVGGPYTEWPDCLSSLTGCQTQASYDQGLGWSFTTPNCLYTYGVTGVINAAATKADGTTYAAGTTQDLTVYTNQGDCLANGFAWDNWLPVTGTTTKSNADGGEYAGMPAGAVIRRLDALTSIEDGGGEFYSGTGSVCQKCHADQSRSYQERQKPGFPKTRHKLAGDALGKPFQPNFTAAGSDWGLQGVQCAMCHSTAKPAQDDLIQVVPAGVVGPPAAGAPKSASGHNQTEYGTHLIGICYTCHGTAATPSTVNPASVIPSTSTDFVLTSKGLPPIANQFMNSPHAKYTGSSTKVDVGNKTKYGSSFEGYVCRTGAGKLSATTYPNAAACTGAGLNYAWYTTTSNGSFCYHTATSCAALPGGQWSTGFAAAAYPWAGDTGGPGAVCAGVGIGSIITTVYRNGVAEKIHNLDSTVNTACTNPGDGSATSGAAGFWVKDGETSPGGDPADTAQGNCMTCHDVHWALADTDPEAEPLRRECTSCHVNTTTSASGAPQIVLSRINHLASTGTPLEHLATDPNDSCETCHMPKSSPSGSPMHLWRINTSGTYTTMGAGQANLAADGGYATAAWVDIDRACGQCHGGSGSAQPGMPYFTTGQLATAARGMHQTATGTDVPPIAAETCTIDDNWTVTMIDASSDDNGIKQETVTWGDGSVVLDDRAAPWGPYLHTYIGANNYTITHKVVDTMGQLTQHTCAVTASTYTISGVVSNDYTGHTGVLPGAIVTVTRVSNGIVAGSTVTDALGAYSVGSVKPGDYTVAVSKIGFSFPAPTTTHVGPSQVVDVNSPTPALRAVKPAKGLKKDPTGSGSVSISN